MIHLGKLNWCGGGIEKWKEFCEIVANGEKLEIGNWTMPFTGIIYEVHFWFLFILMNANSLEMNTTDMLMYSFLCQKKKIKYETE